MESNKETIKTSKVYQYISIIIPVIIYIFLMISLRLLSHLEGDFSIRVLPLDVQSVRGIITQFKMLISIFLVIRPNEIGYRVSLALNLFSIVFATMSMIAAKSLIALPGIASYIGVIFIITVVNFYKRRMTNQYEEIVEQKHALEKSKSKLYKMAFYDSLTKLPRKELFISQLQDDIYSAKRQESLIGVMFIDLDSFKVVNDTMGHAMGDIVLQTVAKRLTNCLRKEDMVSRFAGDEFLIKITNIKKMADIYKVSDKIMDVLQQPVFIQDIELAITASAGIAVYPIDGDYAEKLIKNADIAMYLAKDNGKNQCAYSMPQTKDDTLSINLPLEQRKNEKFVMNLK